MKAKNIIQAVTKWRLNIFNRKKKKEDDDRKIKILNRTLLEMVSEFDVIE